MSQHGLAAPVRLSPAAKPAHGLDNRGLEAGAIPGAHFGRFGRMFPFSGNMLPDECLRDIAIAMIKPDVSKPLTEGEPVDENPAIPAGYTYFGQFVDHDITLDPTSLKARGIDVSALEDFRTPALDLDCIYGSGPDDQPYMYEADGLRLRLGAAVTHAGAVVGTGHDLLRLRIDGETDQRAIIGDKRNDENRIVSQLQALFIAFHNKVVTDRSLIEQVGGIWEDEGSRFRSAVNIVRWHYQWLVLNDYLHRILATGAVAERFDANGVPTLPLYDKAGIKNAYIPVEFAGAAYRFGHSMVRPGYALNGIAKGPTKVPDPDHPKDRTKDIEDGRISLFSRDANGRSNLNGFGVPLPDDWGADFSFFFDNVAKAPQTAANRDFKLPQPSYRIDAQLVGPLANLPEFFAVTTPHTPRSILGNLAYRNLVRGVANLRLPSGEQVARALGIVPLKPEILWTAGSLRLPDVHLDDDAKGDLAATNERRKVVFDKWVNGTNAGTTVLRGNTPLWYYLLREAEYYGTDRVQEGAMAAFGGQFLGPIGSRLVAETFVGLLWNDPMSYLRRWPSFKPLHPIAADPDKFTVGELATWVLS